MTSDATETDVLLLGDHPAAHLAAVVLGESQTISVRRSSIPGDSKLERAVLINPAVFDLHKKLKPLQKKLKLTPVHGLHFLADDPKTEMLAAGNSAIAYVADGAAFAAATEKLAAAESKLLRPGTLSIDKLDEQGVEVLLDGKRIRAKALLIAGQLDSAGRRRLGIADRPAGDEDPHYSRTTLRTSLRVPAAAKFAIPMSLSLGGSGTSAWLLPGRDGAELAVLSHCPLDAKAAELQLRRWANVLIAHELLQANHVPHPLQVTTESLPAAAALSLETVANRSLLIGPGGGFIAATGEEIYPSCWSAILAAEVMVAALKQSHVQDALNCFPQKWGATLGDYLRGPQQNLKFLLPLVYRNASMANRLAQAILCGAPMV